MPEKRLQKARNTLPIGYQFGHAANCVCTALALNGDVIPIGVVWRCPQHPDRTFMRGPSGMAS